MLLPGRVHRNGHSSQRCVRLVGGILGIDEKITVCAFLHQSFDIDDFQLSAFASTRAGFGKQDTLEPQAGDLQISISCVSEASLPGDPVSLHHQLKWAQCATRL